MPTRVVSIALLLLAFHNLPCAAESLAIEEIVAKVNADIITRSELDRDCRTLMTERRSSVMPEPRHDQQFIPECKDTLRERIDRVLLSQKALEMGISVDADLSRKIAHLQVATGISDSEQFERFVQEQTGLPYAEYRDTMRGVLLQERVLHALVGRNIVIPHADVQKYFEEHTADFVRTEQVLLEQIFLSTERKNAAQTEAIQRKAKELSERAKRGERFRELANLPDAGTKADFTEVSGFHKADLDEEIAMAVWNQERGFVTSPIRRSSPNGFLILRVVEKHRQGQATLAEVETEIRERLYTQRFPIGLQSVLTKLREEAFLAIKTGYVDTGATTVRNTAWPAPLQFRPETVTKEEVVARPARRRLLGAIPIPGTNRRPKIDTSTSK